MQGRTLGRVVLHVAVAMCVLGTACTPDGGPGTDPTSAGGLVALRVGVGACLPSIEVSAAAETSQLVEGTTGTLNIGLTNAWQGACVSGSGEVVLAGTLYMTAGASGAAIDEVTTWARAQGQVLPSSLAENSAGSSFPTACPGGLAQGCASAAQTSYGKLEWSAGAPTSLGPNEAVAVAFTLRMTPSAPDLALLGGTGSEVAVAVKVGGQTLLDATPAVVTAAQAVENATVRVTRNGSAAATRTTASIAAGATTTVTPVPVPTSSSDPDNLRFEATADATALRTRTTVTSPVATADVSVVFPIAAESVATVSPTVLRCGTPARDVVVTFRPSPADATGYATFRVTVDTATSTVVQAAIHDDGIAGDATSADGIYSAMLAVPAQNCAVPITSLSISAHGVAPGGATTRLWRTPLPVVAADLPEGLAAAPSSSAVAKPSTTEAYSSTRVTLQMADPRNSEGARAAVMGVDGQLVGVFSSSAGVVTWQVDLPPSADYAALAARKASLAATAGVATVDLAAVVAAGGRVIPNDSSFEDQWYLRKIGAEQAWVFSHGSSSVPIAVVDTGVTVRGEALKGKMLPGYDFVDHDADPKDESGHGTFVAGEIAANPNDGADIAGVLWAGRIMPIRVLDANDFGTSDVVANGIDWAVAHGAKVINLSLAGTARDATMLRSLDAAARSGVVVVAAAGNSGSDTPQYPAAYERTEVINGETFHPNVISVGATTQSDAPKDDSNFGPTVDVAAPGNDMIGLSYKGGLEWRGQTSTAAPLVAGAAAMILAAEPTLTIDAVRNRIERTGVPVNQAGTVKPMGKRLSLSEATFNGSFETGDLSGWQSTGDTRVLTGFGSIRPTSRSNMAMLTTASAGAGTVRKPVRAYLSALGGGRVTINVRYNFVTEAGSSPGSTADDRFNIALVRPGPKFALLAKGTVSGSAMSSAGGADLPGGATGTVRQTGWKSASITVLGSDLPDGSSLRFYVKDAGDSATNSALLVDSIVVAPPSAQATAAWFDGDPDDEATTTPTTNTTSPTTTPQNLFTLVKSVLGEGNRTMEIGRQQNAPRYLGVRIVGESNNWSDIGGSFLGGSFNANHLVGHVQNGRRLVAAIGQDGILRAKWWKNSWDADWHQPTGIGFRLDPQNLTVIQRTDGGLNLYADRAGDGERVRISQNGSGLDTGTSWSVALVEPYSVIETVADGAGRVMEIARQKDAPGYLGVRIRNESDWSEIGGSFLGASFNANHLVGYLENGRRLVAAIGQDGILRAKFWNGSWDANWHQPAGTLGLRLDPQNLTVIPRADGGLNLYADRNDGIRLRVRQNGTGTTTSASWTVEEAPTPTPLYRYVNYTAGDHFYTIVRADAGLASLGWSYEGCEGQVYQNQVSGTTPLVAYWNVTTGDHFYTVEPSNGYAYYGYQQEPYSSGFVYHYNSPASGTVPLYRYFSSTASDHFYTVTRNDAGYASFGYSFERIEAYVLPPPAGGCP